MREGYGSIYPSIYRRWCSMTRLTDFERSSRHRRIGPTSVGLRFDAHARSYQVALKHSRADGEDEDEVEEEKRPILWKAMKKIVIQPEEKRVQAYTQRLSYGPLSLQGIGEYDRETNEWGIRWQLQTFHKEKKRLRSAPLELNDRVTGCLRWDVKSDAPEAEGKYTSAERFSFDVDVGSYHVHVPRLELKVDL